MLRERKSNGNILLGPSHKPKHKETSLPDSKSSIQLTINFTGDIFQTKLPPKVKYV